MSSSPKCGGRSGAPPRDGARGGAGRLPARMPARGPRAILGVVLATALASGSASLAAPDPSPSASQSNASPSPEPAKPPAPAAIPVPEVAGKAEEVAKTLRDFDAIVAPGPAVEAIEKRLPDINARIAAQTEVTTRQLDEKPSGPTLDALSALWRTTRVELTGYVDLLTKRATDLEGVMDRLTTLRATWVQTRTEARASRAPAPVIERIDSVVAAIDASATRLQKERTATLVLQDRVVQQMARCETVLTRITEMRHGLGEQVLVQDTPPIWRVDQLAHGL